MAISYYAGFAVEQFSSMLDSLYGNLVLCWIHCTVI